MSANALGRRLKSFRLLAGISIYWLSLSFLTDGLTTLVLPHDVERLAGESKATWLGLLTFGGLVVAMLVQPFAGLYSDRTRERWGRRGMIAIGLALTLPSLALYSLGSLGMITVGYVLTLAFASVSQAGQQGFIPDLVPAGRRGLASGLKGFTDLAGATLGFVVLGQVVGSDESRSAVVMSAVLVAGFLLTSLLVKESSVGALPPTRNSARTNPFRLDLRRHPRFGWLVASRFFFLSGTYAVGRFFLFFVGDRLSLNPDQAAEQTGSLLGALTLITLLAAPLAGQAADRVGRLRVMQLGAALSAVGALLLVHASSAGQILTFGSLMALGNAAFAAANWAMTADLVPAEEAARFMGVANLGTMGAAALAGLVGPLVDVANSSRPGSGYTVVFIAAAAASVGALFTVRRVRGIPEDREATEHSSPNI